MRFGCRMAVACRVVLVGRVGRRCVRSNHSPWKRWDIECVSPMCLRYWLRHRANIIDTIVDRRKNRNTNVRSSRTNVRSRKFGLSEFPCRKIRIVRISMLENSDCPNFHVCRNRVHFLCCTFDVSCLSCSVRLDFRLQHFPYSARRLHAFPCKVELLLIHL